MEMTSYDGDPADRVPEVAGSNLRSVKKPLPAELEAAVARARERAKLAGELDPKHSGTEFPLLPDEARRFVEQVLSNGSYAEEISRLGAEDPEIATL